MTKKQKSAIARDKSKKTALKQDAPSLESLGSTENEPWNVEAQTFSLYNTIEASSIHIKHLPWKRIFDVLFSLLVLTIGLPVYLTIALITRFSSNGPAIYAQERIGRGGRPFKCYKFRTMFPDADARLNELLKKDASLNTEWQHTRKLKNDPRVTPFGKFLRKTSLDELPQFWNVLKGDLSVVGPRPVVKDEIIHHFGEKSSKILSVRPGLTGIWQVSGRNDVSYQQRIKLDEEYIEKFSFFLDVKLILMTIPAMLKQKGAY